ncbi:hypothetical protein Tco_1000760, partial [Tanacetum coccineum]
FGISDFALSRISIQQKPTVKPSIVYQVSMAHHSSRPSDKVLVEPVSVLVEKSSAKPVPPPVSRHLGAPLAEETTLLAAPLTTLFSLHEANLDQYYHRFASDNLKGEPIYPP